MTDGRTITPRHVLSGLAFVMVLAGACSPAPVASEAASKEAPVDAFNRNGAVIANAPQPQPGPASAAPAALTQMADATMPAGPTAPIAPASLPGPQATTRPQAAMPAPSAAQAALRPGSLPDTPGKATVQRVCSSCHAIGMVTAKGRTEEGWSEVIGQMIGNGMEASDDDLQTIHAYLTREFPPK